jgi:hypothetical protein
MKTSINQFLKILILLIITSITFSCTDKKKEEDQHHQEVMNEVRTEMIDGDNLMHEDDKHNGQMMDDPN